MNGFCQVNSLDKKREAPDQQSDEISSPVTTKHVTGGLTMKSPAGAKRSGISVRWTDRFGDAWQITPSDCATSLGPGMYGRCNKLSPSYRRTRKRWYTEIASATPDDTPRGLSREVQACDILLCFWRDY